jgi:hypothetical protein
MLYDFLSESLASHESNPTSRTGSITKAAATPVSDSQNTLTATDLVTPWRGPQPHKDTKRAI